MIRYKKSGVFMIELDIKQNLLKFLNEKLWDDKITDTGYNYCGLILDYIFDDSIFCLDYLNIEDMIKSNCGLDFKENYNLAEEYKNINDDQFIKLIETITNILLKSSYKNINTKEIGLKILKYIERNTNVKITKMDDDTYEFNLKYKFSEGSYNDIIEIDKNTLKKIMKPEYANQEQFVKRFKYEFEIMNKLAVSPYILKVYDFNEIEHSYLMEKCECDIDDYIKKNVSISDIELFHLFDDILQGVKTAHDNNIIHRDLHLGNILKINNDFVICDFGLGKDLSKNKSLKSSSTPKNAHYFMDPIGKIDFKKLDKSSDLYSVAKIFEYILEATGSKINMDFVIEKATSLKKEKRHNNVDEFIKDYNNIKDNFFLKFNEQEFIKRIKSNSIEANDIKEIIQLATNEKLSIFILLNNLTNFSDVILSLPFIEQGLILESIESTFYNATEHNKFEQYDVFSNIAYSVIINSQNPNIKQISSKILEGCAIYRFSAQEKLKDLKFKKII